ncbi:MAG: pyrroline-5-carboxylate reductase [Alphaproteobacteria bacterium]|nr:MAG: pyrroline-5-carboxylate reductase [Alphaproteobacteria bacterium]
MSKLSQISADHPLLLIGCGKMGGAMLQGWLKAGLSEDAVKIVDPYLDGVRKMLPALPDNCFAETISDLAEGLTPGFIVLAVKPQMMDQAVEALKDMACDQAAFLSIAAGKTIGYFERHLGQDAAIVRAMPNTPAAIGRGITVGCANKNVSEDQQAVCHDLLTAAGAVEWVSEETLIDAVTAVSGSGPAYVFNLVETLAGAGEAIGLAPELAKKLAMHTICGSAALLEQSELDATQLRINVTSPNGTTEAALNVLMGEDGLGKLMTKAVRAAHQRSKDLAD